MSSAGSSNLLPLWHSTGKIGHVLVRAGVLFLASASAVCFPLGLGKLLWPTGLSAGAEYIFWLASGVNLAGLLILGWRYWPVLLLNIFPAMYLLGEPFDRSALGAAGNVIESLLAWWLLRKLGGYAGAFDRLRPVVVLVVVAVVSPLVGSLTVPALLVSKGTFPVHEFWMAVGNWNLANGAAILMITPFLVGLSAGWRGVGRGGRVPSWEWALWLVAGVFCNGLAFAAVFETGGLNFAFLVFPFAILFAVRFGPRKASGVLILSLVGIYVSLGRNAPGLDSREAAEVIWFVQAFSFVLAATTLVVAALVAERRSADALASEGRADALEAALREEKARLSALRYQINPHFLFNALNSLRSTLPVSASTSREMVTEMSDYLRTTLDSPDLDFVPFSEELNSVMGYLAIEKKRFGEELRVSEETDPSANEVMVPSFLLQPIVENAIKHGWEAAPGAFTICLRSALSEGLLIVRVENTGKWRERQSAESPGVGLTNVRRRLQLHYGDAAKLEIDTENGRVAVVVHLPVRSNLGKE